MAVSLSIQRVFLYQSQLHTECNVTTTMKLFDQELQISCFPPALMHHTVMAYCIVQLCGRGKYYWQIDSQIPTFYLPIFPPTLVFHRYLLYNFMLE